MSKSKIKFLVIFAIMSYSFTSQLTNASAMKILEKNTPNPEEIQNNQKESNNEQKKQEKMQNDKKESNSNNLKSSKPEQQREEFDFYKKIQELKNFFGYNVARIHNIENYVGNEKDKNLKMFSSCHDDIVKTFIFYKESYCTSKANIFVGDYVDKIKSVNRTEIFDEENNDMIEEYLSSKGLDIQHLERLIYTIEKQHRLKTLTSPLLINDIENYILYLRKIIKTIKLQYSEKCSEYISTYFKKIDNSVDTMANTNMQYKNEETDNLIKLYKYINFKLTSDIFDSIIFNLDCLNDILDQIKIYVEYCKKESKIYDDYIDQRPKYPGRKYNNCLDNILIKLKRNVAKILRNILLPIKNIDLITFFKNQHSKKMKEFSEYKKKEPALYEEYEEICKEYEKYKKNAQKKPIPFIDYYIQVKYKGILYHNLFEKYKKYLEDVKQQYPDDFKTNALSFSNYLIKIYNEESKELKEIKKIIEINNCKSEIYINEKLYLKHNGQFVEEKDSEYEKFEKEKDFFDGVEFFKSDIDKITSINKNIKENLEYLILLNGLIFNNIKNDMYKKKRSEEEKNGKKCTTKNINDINLCNIMERNNDNKDLFYETSTQQEDKKDKLKTTNINDIFNKEPKNNISNNKVLYKDSKKNIQKNNLINVHEINISKQKNENINKNEELELSEIKQNNDIENKENEELLNKLYKNLNLDNKDIKYISKKIDEMITNENNNLILKTDLLNKKFETQEFDDLNPPKKAKLEQEQYYIMKYNDEYKQKFFSLVEDKKTFLDETKENSKEERKKWLEYRDKEREKFWSIMKEKGLGKEWLKYIKNGKDLMNYCLNDGEDEKFWTMLKEKGLEKKAREDMKKIEQAWTNYLEVIEEEWIKYRKDENEKKFWNNVEKKFNKKEKEKKEKEKIEQKWIECLKNNGGKFWSDVKEKGLEKEWIEFLENSGGKFWNNIKEKILEKETEKENMKEIEQEWIELLKSNGRKFWNNTKEKELNEKWIEFLENNGEKFWSDVKEKILGKNAEKKDIKNIEQKYIEYPEDEYEQDSEDDKKIMIKKRRKKKK